MPTRILGLAEGDRPSAQSGTPHFLFNALERRFNLVERIEYRPSGLRRWILAARTFRPSFPMWSVRFHTSLPAQRMGSAVLAKKLARVQQEFDVVFQVHGWVRGQPQPYLLYVDAPRLMAERGWPSFIPIDPRERGEILARERRMYAGADHIFVMGAPARDSLIEEYGVDPSRITAVGGGFNFGALPQVGGLARDPRVLFVGKDLRRKGGDLLIEAFREVRQEIPAATLHVVGLADELTEPGLVNHGTVLDRDRLGHIYRSARVFCVPSRYEPWGVALIEAMAHGLACVSTTAGSFREILDHGRAGLLVNPEDPPGLAAALHRVLTDYELARTLGEKAREQVEQRWNWDSVVDRMAPGIERAKGSGSSGTGAP